MSKIKITNKYNHFIRFS